MVVKSGYLRFELLLPVCSVSFDINKELVARELLVTGYFLFSEHSLKTLDMTHFKILLLAFKVLNGLAPSYLSDLLHQYTPQRSLRSSDQSLLAVPMSRLKHRGDRAFAVVAPKLWNKLPLHIRLAPTLEMFKSLLKTHFFSKAF